MVWETASGKELLTLKVYEKRGMSVAFSPDGQRILTGSDDNTAKVWEAATPQQIARWEAEESEAAARLATFARESEPERSARRAAFEMAQKERNQFRPEAIPSRDPQAGPDLIDLFRHYNAGLTQSWHWGTGKSDLSALPQGIQTFGGVRFDVRGLIQAGWWLRDKPYTNRVAGISVDRACARLHFLHAAVNASSATNGTEIGRYVIHHANGQSNEIALMIGQHLAHWRRQTNEAPGSLVVAWMQSDESAARENRDPARLFKTTWENPLPGIRIRSIDLLATHSNAAPFVVAITAEGGR